jgi:hypothetical protein
MQEEAPGWYGVSGWELPERQLRRGIGATTAITAASARHLYDAQRSYLHNRDELPLRGHRDHRRNRFHPALRVVRWEQRPVCHRSPLPVSGRLHL